MSHYGRLGFLTAKRHDRNLAELNLELQITAMTCMSRPDAWKPQNSIAWLELEEFQQIPGDLRVTKIDGEFGEEKRDGQTTWQPPVEKGRQLLGW